MTNIEILIIFWKDYLVENRVPPVEKECIQETIVFLEELNGYRYLGLKPMIHIQLQREKSNGE